MKKKILGLIPTRLNSRRLPGKALLLINNLPMIVHVYKRAKLSKLLDDVIVCCDDKRTIKLTKNFNVKSILTSKKNKNGTERINEGLKKIKKKFDLIVDIQGDEPLINPKHIDEVIKYHLKNLKADIVVPSLKIKSQNNTNIVKVVTNKKNDVLYFSRSNIPYSFKSQSQYIKKHLSIISFKPEALKKFSESSQTSLEKIEDIELLRALEIGLKIKSPVFLGDSFSVDVLKDYKKAIKKINKDKFLKLYK